MKIGEGGKRHFEHLPVGKAVTAGVIADGLGDIMCRK